LDVILAQKKDAFSSLTLIAIEAALLAGEILKDGFGTQFEISSKEGVHNLVTTYDRLCEEKIIELISQHIPSSYFLAEESGITGTPADLIWIVDPLDGTVNFAHKIPLFSVSIAAEQNGEVVTGVVYQPMTQELFVAEKGKGAFLNGNPIRVSPVQTIKESILATGFPYNLYKNPHDCIDHFIDILKSGIPIRRLGSAAIDLAYTAAGRFEGYFEVELGAWDCAAGKLLVEEAGGQVTHWNGQPFEIRSREPIFASNSLIHKAGCAILSREIP
jgi:myo-inositol-1(or 4)-monophosphatase